MGGGLPNIMSLQLAGGTAQSILDEPLAEFPQGPGCLFTLSLLRWQATAAVVEVHPSEALQLWSDCTVDSGSSSLLHGLGEWPGQGEQQFVHPRVAMDG